MTIKEIEDKIGNARSLDDYYPTKTIAKAIMDFLPEELQASLDGDSLANVGIALYKAADYGYWNARRMIKGD